MDHSEGGRAPRKQGRHQRRRCQQCDASDGSRALTLAASHPLLTIQVAAVTTSRPLACLVIEDSASLLELTRGSALQTSVHFASFLPAFRLGSRNRPRQPGGAGWCPAAHLLNGMTQQAALVAGVAVGHQRCSQELLTPLAKNQGPEKYTSSNLRRRATVAVRRTGGEW